jgi:hypothetical protein
LRLFVPLEKWTSANLASLRRNGFCRGLFPALELALDRFANEGGSFLPIGKSGGNPVQGARDSAIISPDRCRLA